MVVSWQGWGVWVGLLFVFWFFAAIAVAVMSNVYIPDVHKAAMTVQWGFAVFLVLYALSVCVVIALRARNETMVSDPQGLSAPRPILHTDSFMWIPLVYWPVIIFAFAALVAGVTVFGVPLFGS